MAASLSILLKKAGRGAAAGSASPRLAPPPSLIRLVRKGADFANVEALRAGSGLTLEQIADAAGIPRRTLTQRRRQGRLSVDESDRLVRLTRLWAAAVDLHDGDEDAARQWLASPKRALGGETPLDYARTEIGAREAEDLIGRLEHGVFS